MITKILFTLLLIIGLVFYVRYNRTKQLQGPKPQEKLVNPRNNDESTTKSNIGWVATAAVAVMIGAAALMLIMAWRDASEVIYIKVVEAGSGNEQLYQAYASDIDDRSFRTTDGRRITLANTERMETTTIPQVQN